MSNAFHGTVRLLMRISETGTHHRFKQWQRRGHFLQMLHQFFNQPIGDWDVSSVTEYAGICFAGAAVFNQPIGNWDVSSEYAIHVS